MPEVDRVLGNEEKLSAKSYAADFLKDAPRVVVNDIMAVKETAGQLLNSSRPTVSTAARAPCSRCRTAATIAARSASFPMVAGIRAAWASGAVVAEARRLVEAGYKEIVLSGVDLTAYGADLPGKPSLGTLAAQILKHVPELPRLRLSSIDSIEADDALMRLIAEEERLMPHFHLVGAVGRRPHPEAHEAPPSPRAHNRILQPDQARCARCRVRRRSDRRISDRDGRDVRTQLSLVDEAGLSYLHVFPVQPAAWHARSADAAAAARNDQGARPRPACEGTGRTRCAPRKPDRKRAGRSWSRSRAWAARPVSRPSCSRVTGPLQAI